MQTLRDIMTPDPVAIAKDASVRDALWLLEGAPWRHLPVIDGDKVVGMLSDRDLFPWRKAALALSEASRAREAEEILARPVSDLMSREALFLGAERPIKDAIDVILDFRVGAVPVVDRDKLVGIVSTADLLRVWRSSLERA